MKVSPVETTPPVVQTAVTPKKRQKSAWREFAETVILTAIVFLAIRAVAQNYQVEGHSMDPTMHNGEFVIVLKADYWFHQPQTGDVVVLKDPEDPSRNFIKRIIGKPGDTVAVHNGFVYLNGQPLHEPYIAQQPAYTVPSEKIPQGYFWVLGDNRNDSNDSHIWGLLPRDYVIGKAWVVYWPPSLWRMVPHASYTAPAAQPAKAA